MKTYMLFACTFGIISAAEKKPFVPPRSEPIPIPQPKQPPHTNNWFDLYSFSPSDSSQDTEPGCSGDSSDSTYFSSLDSE